MFSSGSLQLEDEFGDASIDRIIIPGDDYIPGMTTTLLSSTLDTSTEGYYYNYYWATNNSGYSLRFRVVIKVGNPVSIYPEESLSSNFKDYSGGWRDQLSSYTILEDGVSSTSAITYDDQGNPTKITNFYYEGTRYNHADLSWEGRQLLGIQIYSTYLTTSKTAEIWYTYNDQGIRTSKIIDTNGDGTQDEKYIYSLAGDTLLSEIHYNYSTDWVEDYQLIYTYDYDESLIGFTYFDGTNTEDYIYTFNIQGDVTKILKSDGTVVVEYFYDAYGNITETVGSMSATVGNYNSMRYRGYKYDDEIRMYYLNSRFYNPEIGRFINSDGLLGKVGELGSNNMYSYCANNPIMNLDPDGESFILFTTIIGAIAGLITAYENNSDLLLGALTGGLLGLAVGFVATSNITSFASGVYSLEKKLLTDHTAYISFGAPFAKWEDYCVSFIFWGISGALPSGLKFVNEVFSVPFSYQLAKMGTRGLDFDFRKFAYSSGVRTFTYFSNPIQKSLYKGIAKGLYYWWYNNDLNDIFS